jgi:3-hydroxyacyl-CoA dehydrogenase
MTSSSGRDEQAEATALRHVEAAERAAGRPPGVDLALARPVVLVAIVGGGLMGCGIAAACLFADLVVTLIEQSAEAADQARGRIADLLDGALRRGKITRDQKSAALRRLSTTAEIADAGDADLAIEAVFEDLEAKRQVFRRLAAVLRAATPIATNTSYLDPVHIADGIDGQGRVLGLHFFSPAHVMKLVEVVGTPGISKATLATAFAFAQHLGKVAVPSGICDGFIGNRMLQAYRRQADYLLLDGCLPHEIDQAMRAFGMPMGPYELQDLTGLQIAQANRQRLAAARDPAERQADIGDRLCAAGRFGQRAGKGWYRYQPGDRTPVRDREVEQLIEAASNARGIERRRFSIDEIQNRLLAVLINEGGHILDEGIAARPSDIDLVKIHGYGFPRAKGGPMFHGDRIGRERLRQTMRAVADQSPRSWRIARYLDEPGSRI